MDGCSASTNRVMREPQQLWYEWCRRCSFDSAGRKETRPRMLKTFSRKSGCEYTRRGTRIGRKRQPYRGSTELRDTHVWMRDEDGSAFDPENSSSTLFPR